MKLRHTADDKLDRRERAPEQDGRRDHAPAVSCELITSQAPTPRMATWTKKRTNLVVASTTPPTSPGPPQAVEHRAVDAGPALGHGRQHVHGLHDLGVADRCLGQQVGLDLPAVRRLVGALRVANSLAMLNANSTTAPPTATTPSMGWRIQIRATKIGTHGASKKALTPASR